MSFGATNVIGIILIVEGVLNLLGIMFPYAATMNGKYTPESMKAWIRPMGAASIIGGGGCMLVDTSLATGSSLPSWCLPLGFGITAFAIILCIVFNKIFLKKIK